MHSIPVMLAPPPRHVPLSLRLLNLFNVFAQVGWFVFGFGMIFAWVFMGNADYSFLTFRGPFAQASGVVTSAQATGASENEQPVIAHHYEFSAAGSRFSGTSYTTGDSTSAGEEVTVEYDADDPRRSRIAGMRRAQFGPVVSVVLIFPFIGLMFILFSTLSGLRRNHLLGHGVLAQGKLLSRERTNVTVNNRPVWKLTFEFIARDGRRYEAIARTTEPSRLEDESQESLLYDPARPDRAYVLDELPSRPRFEPNGELGGRSAGYLAAIIPGIVIAANLLVMAWKMDWL